MNKTYDLNSKMIIAQIALCSLIEARRTKNPDIEAVALSKLLTSIDAYNKLLE